MRRLPVIALSVLSMLLVACGGGSGDGGESVPVTPLSIADPQNQSLDGAWPMGTEKQTTAFIVHSQDEWIALWNQRKAAIDCTNPSLTVSQSFCAASRPPPVDFERYTLVGLLIWSYLDFDEPTPRSVTQEEGGPLSVSYRYIDPSHTPAIITTVGRFFLVPRTTAELHVNAKRCAFSC